jgi:hypothetical protein
MLGSVPAGAEQQALEATPPTNHHHPRAPAARSRCRKLEDESLGAVLDVVELPVTFRAVTVP